MKASGTFKFAGKKSKYLDLQPIFDVKILALRSSHDIGGYN